MTDPVLAAALREAPGLTALQWLDMALEAMGRGEYDLAGLQLDRCRAAIARSARPEEPEALEAERVRILTNLNEHRGYGGWDLGHTFYGWHRRENDQTVRWVDVLLSVDPQRTHREFETWPRPLLGDERACTCHALHSKDTGSPSEEES